METGIVVCPFGVFAKWEIMDPVGSTGKEKYGKFGVLVRFFVIYGHSAFRMKILTDFE